MTVGQRIRALRKAAGLSQDDLADLLGTSQRVISTWEVERTEVPASEVPSLAGALGVPITAIFDTNVLVAGSGKTARFLELARALELATALDPHLDDRHGARPARG